MTQGAVAASRCGAIGSGVGTGHHRAVAVLKPRGPRETVQIRSLFWPVCEDAFDTSCVSHWLTGQTGRRTVRSAGSRSSSIVHSRSSQARLAQSALLRPPRAAPAAYTGFATARRGFSTAQRAQLVERSYTREARLLKASRFRLKVPSLNSRAADQAGGARRPRRGRLKPRQGGVEVGGWCGGKATVCCAAISGRGVADEDRASADVCWYQRPLPPKRVGCARGWGRHARRAAPADA
jgi:hypothetical protein